MNDQEAEALLRLQAEAAKTLAPIHRQLSTSIAALKPRIRVSIDAPALAESIRAIAEPAAANAAQAEKALRAMMIPSTEVALQMQRDLEAIMAPMTQTAGQVQRMVQAVKTDLEPIVQRLTEVAERYADVFPEFLTMLREAEWPPPSDLSEVTLGDMARVVDRRRSDGIRAGRNELDMLMLGRHGQEVIELLLLGWDGNLLLRRRYPILHAGVRAHMRRDYECSVPTLLPQIEGIVADGYAHRGRLDGGKYRDYLEHLLGENPSEGLESRLREVARVFFLHTLLAQFEHGQPIDSHPSRHAILHGADVDYAREHNSLKAILAIEAIQGCLRMVSLSGSPVFHRAGCPRISKSNADRLFFRSPLDAGAAGKRPCQYCLPDSPAAWTGTTGQRTSCRSRSGTNTDAK